MELIQHLEVGFQASFTAYNLLYCLVGVFLGTLIGVLPGLGPLATIAMLLPFTYDLQPLSALIMLAGIYYGAQYGGSTTAILINLPGEVSSVVTTLDGNQMARHGRAGAALATAALASFFAGCVGTLVLAGLAAPLSQLAVTFNSPDYFSLMAVGLVGAAAMASGSLAKTVGMIIIGLLLGLVGIDINSGTDRFTFGITDLLDGVEIVSVAMGLFAFADIALALEQRELRFTGSQEITTLWPSRTDFRRMWPSILRGTGLGVMLGVLPGAGPAVASFGTYAMEKKLSRHPGEFGQGAIEGVAGPEAANNSAAQCAFIPTLMLGIPGSGTMALMLAAMMIHNIQPGPRVITQNPDLFWGLVVSMWIGNLMLLVLNLPLVGLWVKLLKIPYRMLYPAILVFCCIGVYSVNNSVSLVYMAAFFGVAGYVFKKLRCEPAPLMLGLVLGPMLEEQFRRSLLVSRGDYTVFFTRPISASLLALMVVLLIALAIPAVRKKRDAAVQD